MIRSTRHRTGFIRRAATALVAATVALPIMVAAGSPATASVRATGLTWYNRTTGVVSSWLLNGAGTVMGAQNLDWHCDVASGCASQWQPIVFAPIRRSMRDPGSACSPAPVRACI